jgi:hypothetical protein
MSVINPSRLDSLIEVNGKKGFQPDTKGGLIWYAEGSKTIKALNLGCIALKQGGNLVLSLGNTQHYSSENLDRNYKNRDICILSDNQAAVKAIGKHQITSELV